MPAPEAHSPIPLGQAPAGHPFVVERITEEAEADRQLLRFLWESGIRPGSRIVVSEVAPYAGTVSILLEGRTVTMGLSAASKIWVYDPMEPAEARKPPRARRAARSRA
jgi:Fe2+ transport system protein FeoA